MTTDKQKLGELGEHIVIINCPCPKCKRPKTLRQLKQNFKCADIVCGFCGYLAQVKAISSTNIDILQLLHDNKNVKEIRKSIKEIKGIWMIID